jgi:hypothetical protein
MWLQESKQMNARASLGRDRYQQFVVRATDERGDPIVDYNLELTGRREGSRETVMEFDLDVHAYSSDASLRCFHVNLTQLDADSLSELDLLITASTGTQLVTYNGFGTQTYKPPRGGHRGANRWQGTMSVTPLLRHETTRLFWPYTTTLLELMIDREPVGKRVLHFLDD